MKIENITAIFEEASRNVKNNKPYYDGIVNNWNKTIEASEKQKLIAIKDYNENKTRDILDFI